MKLIWLILLFATAASYPDVYNKAELQAVVTQRAKDGQIMLFTYASGLAQMWTQMSLELCDELNRLSYPYAVLTHDAAACDDLLAAAAGRVDPPPYCILNSVLHKTHAYGNTVLTLWIRRYHAAALFAESGVGVTLLDADTVITRDFLPLLQQYERDYALVVLGEGPANGGLWHLRASNASSAALWVIKQVERRSTLYEKFAVHSHGVDPGLRMDQDELGDALRVASTPDGSAFDFWGEYQTSAHQEHEFWQRFPQRKPITGFAWKTTAERYSSPFLPLAPCAWGAKLPTGGQSPPHPMGYGGLRPPHAAPAWGAARCARFERFAEKYELRDTPLKYQDICVPFDSEQFDETAPCEKVLQAPSWLFSHGDPLVNGWTDQIAVYHMLGVNLYWRNEGAGSHVSRYVQWLARPGMRTWRSPPTADGSPRHYVALAQHLVDAAAAHTDVVHLKRAVKHLMSHAIVNGEQPVMPRFACNATWMPRADDTALGYADHRVVDDGTWCHPSTAGLDSCFPGLHYDYTFTVPRDATVRILDALPTGGVNITELLQRTQNVCPEFFKELD
jgi:hypothetical protein